MLEEIPSRNTEIGKNSRQSNPLPGFTSTGNSNKPTISLEPSHFSKNSAVPTFSLLPSSLQFFVKGGVYGVTSAIMSQHLPAGFQHLLSIWVNKRPPCSHPMQGSRPSLPIILSNTSDYCTRKGLEKGKYLSFPSSARFIICG